VRINHKLTLALTCAILAVLSVSSFVLVKRELALFEADIPRSQQQIGRAVAGAAARVWERAGEREAIGVIEAASEREPSVAIRWIRLDAPPGDPHASALPPAWVAAVGREPRSLRWRPPGMDDDWLYTVVPVAAPGSARLAIELHGSLAEERAYVDQTVIQAGVATAALVAICALIAGVLGGALVGRPVRELVAHARRIGEGDLAARLALAQRDEIGLLGDAMNAMSERLAVARRRLDAETSARLAAIEQLRHADRLATIGKLSAGIAHEVGTPLNVITGHAQLISDEYPADSFAATNASVIAHQAHRVASIIRELLDFARPRKPRTARHALASIARQAVPMLERMAHKRGVELIARDVDPEVHALVDAAQLQQVVINLVVNALHASAPDRAIELGVAWREVTPPADHAGARGRYAALWVRDHGTGIPAELLPRVFEPFFTTKEVGEGTGLGLSVAYGMIKEHGGWIEVDSQLGRGTCFTIYLPPEDAA
jgi:two-component system, NtrC family, sensor kinase